MDTVVNLLSSNWYFAGVVVTVLLIVVVIYLVAFFQGREVSFWPPKIGAKAEKPMAENVARIPKQSPGTPSNTPPQRELLVQNEESGATFLLDRFGSFRRIRDENTELYLRHILGYETDELTKLPRSSVRPVGPDVVGFRDWRRPRTAEDELRYEARRTLKLLRRRMRSVNGDRVLSFDIRNIGDEPLLITSSELSFNVDPPLTFNDISPRNQPRQRGVLTCTLLVNASSESGRLEHSTDATLDLILQRALPQSEEDALTTLQIGFVAINAIFRNTKVDFHL